MKRKRKVKATCISGVSLDYLMSLPFGEINEFLLQRVTKEEVRNSIKEEINIEFSRRRDEKEGIHVLEKKAKMEPEVFTIDVEEDLEHSPKPCSFSEMRKKPRMEEGLKLRVTLKANICVYTSTRVSLSFLCRTEVVQIRVNLAVRFPLLPGCKTG